MHDLPSEYSKFIHLSRYSRWLPDKKRRETWPETVKRYFDFFEEHLSERCNYKLTKKLRAELEEAVLNLEIMPSMRCLMTAGEALKRDEMAGFNCSYLAIDNIRAFDEILYILMLGCGVGFSVERQYVAKLPTIADEHYDTDTTIVVADSKIGWAKALKELISMLYVGQVPQIDYSRIRPAGSPLKIFGGRASGPGPLKELFDFVIRIFKGAAGRRLQSIECHDIVCKIAESVVVGGVRRSALISLSNLSDDRMRAAKSGQWWIDNNQRSLANNSAAYTEKPDIGIFMDEWKSLYDSKSGERGIFNRQAAQKQAEATGRRDPNFEFGVNPCAEILLRSKQCCNLSEVVVRENDTKENIIRKAKLASILGTFQSTLDSYRYVSKAWEANNKEERLLGVSLTGIMDNKFMSKVCPETEEFLSNLKNHVIDTNKLYANKLGIEQSTSDTCIKPSGTVSQLVNSASGAHTRHSQYYFRTVRADNKDPLCQLMKELGFPWEPCAMKPNSVSVFTFPQKSPDNCLTRNDLSAIEHLKIWLMYKKYWAEHTISVTITVKEHEWLEVASFVYANFDDISGISFLPHSDHVYKQAPYQECTEEEYYKLKEIIPENVDWSQLAKYEESDHTAGTQTYACTGNSCEIVDLT